MTENTDALIAELTLQAQPVVRKSLSGFLCKWLLVSIISLVAITLMYGIREDIQLQLGNPFFVMELAIHGCFMLASALLASAAGFPGRIKKAHFILAYIGASLGYGWLIYMALNPIHTADDTHPHGMACAVCIVSFTVIPALWYFMMVRKLAVTMPAISGSAALCMATAIGCIGVRLVENETAHQGLLLWHFLPLLLLSLCGIMIGQKFIRW